MAVGSGPRQPFQSIETVPGAAMTMRPGSRGQRFSGARTRLSSPPREGKGSGYGELRARRCPGRPIPGGWFIGAGEGIRTPDPNLGKVRSESFRVLPRYL
jgi:hypothetical protein